MSGPSSDRQTLKPFQRQRWGNLWCVSQKFPQRCLWNGSNVRLIDDGPLSSFQKLSFSASSFHASLLQAIDGVMSLALCPQVVSQAPQHFRSSETQATCDGCFARQSICLLVSLHSGMSRAVHPQFSETLHETLSTLHTRAQQRHSQTRCPLFCFN